ncbi:MAG: hypothetical protein R3254_05915 [Thiomicrorhabdus sp.]|nr:hypothetical protein [Thiomicrorhabdus sp.]
MEQLKPCVKCRPLVDELVEALGSLMIQADGKVCEEYIEISREALKKAGAKANVEE